MVMFVLLFSRLQSGVRRSWADPAFRGLVVLISVLWGIGVVFYHHIEGWSWIDSFYFCVVTAATVGYGDLSPQTVLGKLFTIAYILCSVGVFVSLAGTLGLNMARAHRDEGDGEGKEAVVTQPLP
jgi:lysylphosphatidylglycerol synthetase-like protein (DUF2156 family)